MELDGAVHKGWEAQAADKRRTRILNRAGYRVLRFWNSALRQPTTVMVTILNALVIASGVLNLFAHVG